MFNSVQIECFFSKFCLKKILSPIEFRYIRYSRLSVTSDIFLLLVRKTLLTISGQFIQRGFRLVWQRTNHTTRLRSRKCTRRRLAVTTPPPSLRPPSSRPVSPPPRPVASSSPPTPRGVRRDPAPGLGLLERPPRHAARTSSPARTRTHGTN